MIMRFTIDISNQFFLTVKNALFKTRDVIRITDGAHQQ
jgi:hypothetical protein